MIISGYLKTSLIEWPGKIASVIFTQGCNFRCPFCHNRDLVDTGILGYYDTAKRIDQNEVLADLRKRKRWIDAVVITGGEPTLQGDLIEFIKLIKLIKGMKVMVETNGSRPEVIARLMGDKLVDYWTMDVKGNFEGYGGVVGSEGGGGELITRVKESMKLIVGSGVEYEFRTTVVPGLHNLENLKQLANEIRQICQISPIETTMKARTHELKWFFQQFRPVNCLDKSFLKKKGFTKEEMEGFLVEVQNIIPNTYLRGV